MLFGPQQTFLLALANDRNNLVVDFCRPSHEFDFVLRLDLSHHQSGKGRDAQALHVLAYNVTRVMNILGIKPLMAAMRE